MYLEQLGWNNDFAHHFQCHQAVGCLPARVMLAHRGLYTLYTELGELTAEVSGKLRHQLNQAEQFPAIGDWAAIAPPLRESRAMIHQVLPRKSQFSRKMAGATTEM